MICKCVRTEYSHGDPYRFNLGRRTSRYWLTAVFTGIVSSSSSMAGEIQSLTDQVLEKELCPDQESVFFTLIKMTITGVLMRL